MEARIGAQRIIKTIGLEPEQLFITVRLISLFELGERFVLVSEADFDQHDFRERAATRRDAFQIAQVRKNSLGSRAAALVSED